MKDSNPVTPNKGNNFKKPAIKEDKVVAKKEIEGERPTKRLKTNHVETAE